MSYLVHELRYRGPELMARLRARRIVVCGAGALGANLVEQLARMGAAGLRVIDRDRIEEVNLATQPYGRQELGYQKAEIVADRIYRELAVEVEPVAKELHTGNAARLLKGADLVVDCFDNRAARLAVQQASPAPLVHAGMNGDYAEVVWDADYTVPGGAGEDVCDYPLARNLVSLTVACLAEVILRWLETGECQSWSLTLRDFAIRSWPTHAAAIPANV